MKLLMVVHNFPPEFRGGVERTVEEAARALMARGHQVEVLAGSDRAAAAPAVREEDLRGLRVWRLVKGPGLRHPVDPLDPELVPLYERVLDAVRPHLVHVHHWWNLGDDLVRRATARGFATCLTLHDHFATCSLFFRLPDGATPCEAPQRGETCGPCVGERYGVDDVEIRAWIDQRARAFRAEVEAAGAVFAPSLAHAERLRAFLGSEVAIQELPLGTPAVAVPPREGVAFPEGPLRLLHFGHLSRVKGLAVLLDAVRAADPSGRHVVLTLLGDVLDRDLDLGPARHEPGDFDAERLRRAAARADLAVFPSLAHESYGLTVDEALRLGLPVIVSDRGAPAARVGARGLVLPAGDAPALAACLRAILAEPERLSRLRRAPLPVLLTPEEHAEALEAAYRRVLRRPLPMVDLEAPLLERLARWQKRAAEVFALLAGLRSGRAPTDEEER